MDIYDSLPYEQTEGLVKADLDYVAQWVSFLDIPGPTLPNFTTDSDVPLLPLSEFGQKNASTYGKKSMLSIIST